MFNNSKFSDCLETKCVTRFCQKISDVFSNVSKKWIVLFKEKKVNLVSTYAEKIEIYLRKYIYNQNMILAKRRKTVSSEENELNLNW